MISEPEMAEGFGPQEVPEVVSDLAQHSAGSPLRRRPWLWALGGAAAASALWAATLLLLPSDNHSPDLRGYRLDRESCKSARLASLQEALALESVPDTISDELLHHPALDQVHCSLAFRKRAADKATGQGGQGGHWSVATTVDIAVALHKRTDPRDEFDADRRVTDSGVVAADQVRPVPDLGDEAFLIAEDMGHTELRVLDGAAVVTLGLSTTSYYETDAGADAAGAADTAGDGPDLPDVSTYWPAMISDMRALMTDLTRRP
ncbi:hypothetical protein DI272_17920 [Streptomyces sp. Act143]|uniref:hypothetical protein n=1 Tax=Streptomyces sp. Act143 TaxID=2200760 RepID=UPI000D682F83|nr:hypothetical protein [Streptomyces sp. Act143]PWI15837.1 hypothetical protein DI272_17920 [Streptomyces sp. Act143]